MAETTEEVRGRRKVRKGIVVSKSGEKSVIVQGERREAHPKYGKVIRRFKKYHAHDEANAFHTGEIVRIEETAPISKLKTWKVIGRVQASKGTAVEAEV